MKVYDNNNYKIVVSDCGKHYEVTNTLTGVVEATETILPKAVVSADTWSEAIDRHKQKSKETANVVDIRTPR